METKRYKNVAMYRTGSFLGGIHQTNCKTVEITFDVKYAQYNDAVKVVYLEKGKRSLRAFTLCGAERWLRVCAAKDAIAPQDAMVPSESFLPGTTCKVSRYTSCDPRYQTDFEDAAEAAGVKLVGGCRSGRP